MLTQSEEAYVMENAYVPEHLLGYFLPFSNMEPFLEGKYLFYRLEEVLSFIGYPLVSPFLEEEMNEAHKDMEITLEKILLKYKPKDLKIIAPTCPALNGYKIDNKHTESDSYSVLDVGSFKLSAKNRNMITKASRDLKISISMEFTMEHHRMLLEFLRTKGFPKGINDFFHRIPDYIAHSQTAYIINAYSTRTKEMGALKGYNIVDFNGGDFCFYLFNITGDKGYIPGTADLLLMEMVQLAHEKEKKYINMGLAINPGIKKFKEKWGAKDFLNYNFFAYKEAISWFSIFNFSGGCFARNEK